MSEYQCPKCKASYAAAEPWPCPSCLYPFENLIKLARRVDEANKHVKFLRELQADIKTARAEASLQWSKADATAFLDHWAARVEEELT